MSMNMVIAEGIESKPGHHFLQQVQFQENLPLQSNYAYPVYSSLPCKTNVRVFNTLFQTHTRRYSLILVFLTF